MAPSCPQTGGRDRGAQSWLGLCVNLGERMAQDAGQGPRPGSFGKLCLLVGAQLGDAHRKAFSWISSRGRTTTDTPECYSCSSGSSGLKTILFFFLCLFGLVWGVGLGRGGRVLFGQRAGCQFTVGSWVHSGCEDHVTYLVPRPTLSSVFKQKLNVAQGAVSFISRCSSTLETAGFQWLGLHLFTNSDSTEAPRAHVVLTQGVHVGIRKERSL